MSRHIRLSSILLAVALAADVRASAPQSPAPQAADRDLEAIASWVAIDAATGYEGRTSPALAAALGDWRADAWGNVVTTVGSGAPHRIVACALDRPSYAVSQITDEGYLRLHRIGRGSRHPLWDQQFEAQQVRILTATGPVAGVVARANGHFAPQHASETTPVTADATRSRRRGRAGDERRRLARPLPVAAGCARTRTWPRFRRRVSASHPPALLVELTSTTAS
jgi:hypothetical protein